MRQPLGAVGANVMPPRPEQLLLSGHCKQVSRGTVKSTRANGRTVKSSRLLGFGSIGGPQEAELY